MRKFILLVFLLIIGFSFIPVETQWRRIPNLEHPELLTKLISPIRFDFSQQWRKTKKDTDVWIRSEERFSSRMQGIEPLWVCAYGSDGNDYLNTLQPTADGGCVVSCWNSSTFETSLYKISDKGLVEWGKLGQYNIKSILTTADGGYICGGNYDSGASKDPILIKFSSDWDVEWGVGFGGMYADSIGSVSQTGDGGYIVVCSTLSFLGAYPEQIEYLLNDLLIVKFSKNGDVEYQCSMGGPGEESHWEGERRRASVLEVNDGYLVACDTDSFSDNGWRDIWLVKLNRELDKILWQKTYGGKETESLYLNGPHIQPSPDGTGCIVVGYTLSFGVVNPETNTRFADGWIFRVNLANGDIEWQKTYGGERSDWVNCIQPTIDGNYILVGGSNSFNENETVDKWILIIDETGRILREIDYGSEAAGFAKDVKQSSDEVFFIGGETYVGEVSGQNIIILKTDSRGSLNTSCGYIRDSHTVVSDTHVVPSDTYELPWLTNAFSGDAGILYEQVTHLTSYLLCWNLNQPPVNISFERVENKSFFVSEEWHNLTWSPNPYNSDNSFVIAEYKIYRKEREDADNDYSSYQHIATVPGNTYIFVDKEIKANKQYLYVVTSADSEGNESPKSDSVGNVN